MGFRASASQPWGRPGLVGHLGASVGQPGQAGPRGNATLFLRLRLPVTLWLPLSWACAAGITHVLFTLLSVSVFAGCQAVPLIATPGDPGLGLATAFFFLGTRRLWKEHST